VGESAVCLRQAATVEIGDLTEADCTRTVAIWEAAGLTRPWNDAVADFERALAGPTSTVLGGFDGDDLVATVMVGHDGHRGWVYYLAVEPQKQRRGLGARMMREAERWLRDRGAVKLNLMVRHSNTEAMGFYERLDYRDDEVRVLSRRLDE
jgi:ribosomal protein S18 acetylase RimI-like enzyme